MPSVTEEIRCLLHSFASEKKAATLKKYFKTGKGEYAERDIFIGVTVPNIRLISKKFYDKLTLSEITKFLHSKIHEERFLALLILVKKFEKSKESSDQKSLVDFYLKNTAFINNWDLVDISCYNILGSYLFKNQEQVPILYHLSKSSNLWEKRISAVSTLAFIKQFQFQHTLNISKSLFIDKHHLIHKAIGWMLREIGKKDKPTLLNFLKENHLQMPRISISYAIERLAIDEKSLFKKIKL